MLQGIHSSHPRLKRAVSLYVALRTRRISFILHLSEVRLTTRPVISMDMDGLRCIPIDPIGFHSTNRYRRIQSDNISALSDFHLTSGTFFASNLSYFLGKVLRIYFCQFHRKTTRVPHNFGLFLIQKFHFMIINFKSSRELVAIVRNFSKKSWSSAS